MEQSAVEWLLDSLDYNQNMLGIKEIIEKAKEMEKEQIKNAYSFGIQDEYVICSKQYYNETFKSK